MDEAISVCMFLQVEDSYIMIPTVPEQLENLHIFWDKVEPV